MPNEIKTIVNKNELANQIVPDAKMITHRLSKTCNVTRIPDNLRSGKNEKSCNINFKREIMTYSYAQSPSFGFAHRKLRLNYL